MPIYRFLQYKYNYPSLDREKVINRIHKLGPSKSFEMIGESPAQTKGIGIDKYAETAPVLSKAAGEAIGQNQAFRGIPFGISRKTQWVPYS
jgi:hypothetical protein